MTSLAHPDSLRAQVARGARWKLAGQVAAQVSRAAVTVTLARLLSPRGCLGPNYPRVALSDVSRLMN